jgi:hypothetical protein
MWGGGSDQIIMAARHVMQAQRIVHEQRARVERLRAIGASTVDAEDTLRAFEGSLKIFEDHLAFLKR